MHRWFVWLRLSRNGRTWLKVDSHVGAFVLVYLLIRLALAMHGAT